jgi:hypothetical protein
MNVRPHNCQVRLTEGSVTLRAAGACGRIGGELGDFEVLTAGAGADQQDRNGMHRKMPSASVPGHLAPNGSRSVLPLVVSAPRDMYPGATLRAQPAPGQDFEAKHVT